MPEESAPLFTAADLSAWLGGESVDAGRAAVVERVVWGWLLDVLSMDTRPVAGEVPDALFSWAIELGAIAHENPAGLSSKQHGDVGEAYSAERRDAILAAVAGSSLGNGTDGARPARPRGRFPEATPYPDPVDPPPLAWMRRW